MFVFYDTETTGLDPDFTQILQISLVFTDDDLNVLSSKKMECRRSPWVIPSPGAMLITGFVPDDLKFGKYSHYEMMMEVDAWLRSQHWPLTFIGYNSINYDEPMMAQNLYQNLLDPNLTSSRNDINGEANGRADVMTVVKAVATYMPGVLKLDDLNDYGTPALGLVNVARQNGITFAEEDAHDSMNDVKATVAVAKLLKKAAPQIWEQMMSLSTVDSVDEFLKNNSVFTYAYSFGKGKSAVATSLTAREGSDTQVLFDLTIDPAPYLNMSVEQLKGVFLAKPEKTGTKEKPFVLMRKGSQPVLMPMDLSAAVLPASYDEKLSAARAKTLQSNAAFLDNVAKAALLAKQEQMAAAQKSLPEQMIDREIPDDVKERLEQWVDEFHAAPEWKDGVRLIDDFYVRFKEDLEKDPCLSRFVKFAGRIVYEHAPEELGEDKQEAMRKYIGKRALNPDLKAPYMTVARARKELEQIERERASGKKWQDVTDSEIRSLKLYYTSIEKEYAAYAPANNNAPAPLPEVKKPSGGGIQPK